MSQFQFNFEQPNELELPNAQLRYEQNFIGHNEATQLFEHFSSSLNWTQDHIKIAGKRVLIPRLQAWYGAANAQYQYSGIQLIPLPWTKQLQSLRNKCADYCGENFNSVLANLYRDGSDSVGWHADDEPELGPEPVIASISLGCAREFEMRHNATKQKAKILLEHGSLLVMKGTTQKNWQHQIAKHRSIIEPRINLTFRVVDLSYNDGQKGRKKI
ncbi:alpha-ketoglutarate-dependent dioxygenase AlkB [Alteromonadaceae bacterium BrNp21-10]|nr:alpha-ketoglutarate-dependent dioxygenase AlkB [Alteromonadaceae bacterium BrNp21-10]